VDYCTVENLKAVLQVNENKWDIELAECVTSATVLVGGLLAS
jgi:hypothetical protein